MLAVARLTNLRNVGVLHPGKDEDERGEPITWPTALSALTDLTCMELDLPDTVHMIREPRPTSVLDLPLICCDITGHLLSSMFGLERCSCCKRM